MQKEKKRQIEFVMKVSKYCNLRCSYCYEFNELSDRRRLDLAGFEKMLGNLKRHAGENWEGICFIWHGGEPLLVKPAFYESIGALQARILNGDVAYWNFAQSNLTALGEHMLQFIVDGHFFRGVGVSVDPFGTERVDERGRSRNDLVFANMRRLQERGYEFACITVLTPKSLPFVAQTFDFFASRGIRFRVLPYDFSASDEQANTHALTGSQHVAALSELFDLWLMSGKIDLRIDPIYEYMLSAMRYRNNAPKKFWDMARDESVFTVELDGSLWGRPTGYMPGLQYGNLTEEDLETILDSKNRKVACQQSQARMEKYCGACPYYGYCPGKYVGNSTEVEQAVFQTTGCWVRHLIDHMAMRLDELGIDPESAPAPTDRVSNDTVGIAIANA